MTREDLIRQHFDRGMRLLELGPSHRPILPKADGWHTTIIDHADEAELRAKYTTLKVAEVDRIEPVDYVWQSGPLTDLVPASLHGTFDGLVASHVAEHFPDLIAFFKDASALLAPHGLIALALPDKRVCFDFFQPLTMTGDIIDAHARGRSRHQLRTIFNHTAYFTLRNGEGGWSHGEAAAPFTLANSIYDAQRAYESSSEDPSQPYSDCHAWAFTPKSFELIMLELNLLGHTDWAVRSIEAAEGVEFFIWLERRRIDLPKSEVDAARLSLLAASVQESMDAIVQLNGAQPAKPASDGSAQAVASWPKPVPTVAAIIPLHNGAAFIEEALNSVFRQSVAPSEVIVVDDGSTDDGAGAAIVRRMAETHPITLMRKENGGQSSARNFGVRHSTSELIAFLDQDDVWYDNHLEQLTKPFLTWSARPLGWVYSNLDEVHQDGALVCRNFLSTLGTAHPKRHIFDCVREDMFVLPSAAVINRHAFEAIGGFDEQLCGYEDDDLFLRMFLAGYENIFLDMPLSRWRIYDGSTSYSPRMARSRSIYMRKLAKMFPDDVKRAHYYMRDLISPRFIPFAIREYRNALRANDSAGIAAARADLDLLFSHLEDKRVRWKIILTILRFPFVVKCALAVRRGARPILSWVH